jgi:hypothetical protein
LHALDALVAYGSELRLIYNTITTYFLRKMLNRGTCDWVSNLFLADEAQLLIPKILHKIVVTESWPATEFATRIRKRGCGLVLMTQSPSNIEQDIFKNVGTKFAFRLQFEEDIRLISEAAGFFDPVEFEYLADKMVRLPRKSAIVCTTGHEPFLVTADEFEIANVDVETEIEPVDETPESDDGKTFIDSITGKPFLSVMERRADLGWDDKRYNKTVNDLLQKGKIQKVSVSLGRGSPRVLYQLPNTIPSVKHEFYVNWLAESLKAKGFGARKNKEGADIVIPELSVAIEVELGKSDIHGNIRRNLQQFKKVFVCSDQKKLLEGLSGQTKAQNIFFLPVQNLPALLEKMRSGNELEHI